MKAKVECAELSSNWHDVATIPGRGIAGVQSDQVGATRIASGSNSARNDVRRRLRVAEEDTGARSEGRDGAGVAVMA